MRIITPVAGGILNVGGETPVAHEKTAASRLEFPDQFGEGAGIHDGPLLRLEARQDFQPKGRAGSMHESGQKGAFDMLAAFACDLLRPQPRKPRFAPEFLGLWLMSRCDEYLAAQHHRHGDI